MLPIVQGIAIGSKVFAGIRLIYPDVTGVLFADKGMQPLLANGMVSIHTVVTKENNA